MNRLSEDKINEIRLHADIADVLSRYVPLTRKGRNFVCTCPFHDDHNPSMSVTVDKQIYKCFVCGAGGNVFTFVQNFEHISFIESVIKVADYAGVFLDEQDRVLDFAPADPVKQAIHKVNQTVIDYTNYTLSTPSAIEYKAYLHQRGIHDETIQRFQMGYNPKNDELYKYLVAKKFPDSELVESNVVRMTDYGIHDVFSHRILIPIHDRLGNPIGFTARRLEENDDAKYVNTSETACFHKGSIIFNYHRAKIAAKQTQRVLVVEGAMDVIAFDKVNIADCVATLGTACTKEQISLLKNLHCKVVLCYDGDQAGINATYKFGKLANEVHMPFEIVDNQLGLDPDEIIDHYGKEELIQVSQKTISWIDFLFRFLSKRYNLENYSQRKEMAQEISHEIATTCEPYEKTLYYKKLYELTQFDLSSISQETNVVSIQRKGTIQSPKNGSLRAEYEILSQMLVSMQANNTFREKLGFLIDEQAHKLAMYIIDYYRTHPKIEIADFLNYIKEEDIKKLLIEISEWEMATDTYHEDVFLHSCIKIRISCLEDKIKKLVQASLLVSDPIQKAKYADEIIQLKRQKTELVKEVNV